MKDVAYDPNGYGVSYQALIDTMEFDDVLVEESDDDYQGDTYMLVDKLGRYGFLLFGWGSCSGCDAAQAVSSQAEANELRNQLYSDVKWFDTAREMIAWFEGGDHKLKFYGHDDTFEKFTAAALAILESRAEVTDEEVAQAVQSIQTSVRKSLGEELADLERTDPAVAEAAAGYDRMVDRLLNPDDYAHIDPEF